MLKSRTFLYFGVSLYYFLFYCIEYSTDAKSNSYQVVLRKVQNCETPQPPFAKKRLINPILEIYTTKDRSYVRGNSTVKGPVPFRNFSAQSFLQTSTGQREAKYQILGVSCRNFIAAAILKFSNISISQKNCLMLRGFYTFSVDVDKITHSLPIWHESGYLIHVMQLVANGTTLLCNEIHVEIQARGQ